MSPTVGTTALSIMMLVGPIVGGPVPELPDATREVSAGITSSAPDAVRAWTKRKPATAPPTTESPRLTYDSGWGRVVMFGGEQGDELADEMWTWDGVTWEQFEVTDGPTARTGQAMAYDPVRREIVLFGGYEGDGWVADTWVYAGGKWTQRNPDVSPPPMAGAAFEFDPHLQQMLMFGGYASGRWNRQTWTWDGSTWARLHPTSSPSKRSGAGLVYNPSRDSLVLFGGSDGVSGTLGTWSWDGTSWVQESLRAEPPSRWSQAMATFHDHVVLFGGMTRIASGIVVLDDTWVLKERRWKQVPVRGPFRRAGATMEWDPVCEEVVLFGHHRDAKPSDTWVFHRRARP